MNALERVVAGAARTLKGIGGKQVVYVRRGFESEPITAVRTVAEYFVEDSTTGLPVRMRYTDWLFVAAEILVDGKRATPQALDRIKDGEKVYQVQPLDAKRGCFHPHDAGGQMIVVHTVEVQCQEPRD